MENQTLFTRRGLMPSIGLAAGLKPGALAAYQQATRGLPALKIASVRTILTCPNNIRTLVVVKVETSEPGCHGLGCSTGSLRPFAVKSSVDDYLHPFVKGKDPDNIEDLCQTSFVSSYWRNGSILNSALSGLDQALWDIKAKRAGMPLHQLLGGKCRFAAECYGQAGGRTLEELEQSVQKLMESGFRHIRIQLGGYGSGHLSTEPDFRRHNFGAPDDEHMDPGPYLRAVPRMFEHIRNRCGEEVELLHDIHERVPPMDAIQLVKCLEVYRPFFIEDPFAPEDIGYFRVLRQQSATPIAMGELFNLNYAVRPNGADHQWGKDPLK